MNKLLDIGNELTNIITNQGVFFCELREINKNSIQIELFDYDYITIDYINYYSLIVKITKSSKYYINIIGISQDENIFDVFNSQVDNEDVVNTICAIFFESYKREQTINEIIK